MAGYVTSPFPFGNPGEEGRREMALFFKAHGMGITAEKPTLSPYWPRDNAIEKAWCNTFYGQNMYYTVPLFTQYEETLGWQYMLEENWDNVRNDFAAILNYFQASPNRLIQPDGLTLSVYSIQESCILPASADHKWLWGGYYDIALAIYYEYFIRLINWLWDTYVPPGGTLRIHQSPFFFRLVSATSSSYTWLYDNMILFLNAVAAGTSQSTRNIHFICAPQDCCGLGRDPSIWGIRDPRPGYDTDGTFAKLLLCYNAHYNAFADCSQATKNRARVNVEALDWEPYGWRPFGTHFYHQIDRLSPYSKNGCVSYAWFNYSGYQTFFHDYSNYFNPMPLVTWINS